MSLPVDAKPGIPGAQGAPIAPAEKQIDPLNSLIVQAVATIFEWTSFCKYLPGRDHKTKDGDHLYSELVRIDCHGRDKGCPNYPSKKEEPQVRQDPPPQQKDS